MWMEVAAANLVFEMLEAAKGKGPEIAGPFW